jgi:hypothetical protein
MVTAGWMGDLAGVEVDTDNGSLSFEYILGKIFIPLVRRTAFLEISFQHTKFNTQVGNLIPRYKNPRLDVPKLSKLW